MHHQTFTAVISKSKHNTVMSKYLISKEQNIKPECNYFAHMNPLNYSIPVYAMAAIITVLTICLILSHLAKKANVDTRKSFRNVSGT